MEDTSQYDDSYVELAREVVADQHEKAVVRERCLGCSTALLALARPEVKAFQERLKRCPGFSEATMVAALLPNFFVTSQRRAIL